MRKAFDTKSKAFENKSKAFDTKSKAFENKSKAFDTKSKAFENKSKAFDTKSKAFENKSKAFDKTRDMNMFAMKLQKKGFYCIESKFKRVLFAEKEDELAIISGNDGIAITVDNIPKFCEELIDVYELLQDRKNKKIVIS